MLTKDCWTLIFSFLNPSDILSCASTSKVVYRSCAGGLIRKKVSGGMIGKYKPNTSQWSLIEQILRDKPEKFWISGDVGVGKTATAMVTALQLKPVDKKLVIVVPPNLIAQWDNLLKQQFGIEALVMHSYNKKYKNMTFTSESDIKADTVLMSNCTFTSRKRLFDKESMIIIDECKKITYNVDSFRYCIGINACVTSKSTSLPIYVLADCAAIQSLQPVEEKIYRLPVPNWDITKIIPGELHSTLISTYLSFPFYKHRPLPYPIQYKNKLIERRSLQMGDNRGWSYLENSPKFQSLLEIVRKLGTDKAILFDRNIDYLPFIAFLLEKHGINTYLFTTDYSPVERIQLLENFKNGTGGILLTSYTIMGEGHNLPEANHIICYGSALNTNMKKQVVGRCQRFRQIKQVYVHRLYSSPIDECIDNYDLDCNKFLFEGISRRIKLDFWKQLIGGYGYWCFTTGAFDSNVDLEKVWERIRPKDIVKEGMIGHFNEKQEIVDFQVVKMERNGERLVINVLNSDQTLLISKRSNGKYHEVGTSMNSVEYYF